MPILGSFKTLLILPALFSCADGTVFPADAENNAEVTTKVMLEVPEDHFVRGSVDIFAFSNEGAGHLDSYQHMDSFTGQNISLRSRSGEKKIFICANGQRSAYGWAIVNSTEALDKIYLELQKERRMALCGTATGVITAGHTGPNHMELRRIASEIVLRSIRCDFTGSGYDGESITDVCVYLTNVNSRCPVTADGEILPGETINSGKLDMEDVAGFSEPDMVYQRMSGSITADWKNVDMSFICYPNTSSREGPGTPFTRLVIEGRIEGETYWWPIDINRDSGTESPGIHRNSSYVYDVSITRKGVKDPDTAIGTEAAEVAMDIMPWREMDDRRVMFHDTEIVVRSPGQGTRAILPEENAVNDINLLVFSDGIVEKSIWKDAIQGSESIEFSLPLVKDRNYSIAVLANLGRRLKIKDYSGWEETAVEMSGKEGFPDGLPMSAFAEGITPEKGGKIAMELSRLTAKLSIRMDRSLLDKDVNLNVRHVRIGNLPKHAYICHESKAGSYHDVYERGFELDAVQCKPLNTTGKGGASDEVSVYMLENMQGGRPDPNTTSFIEIEMDYLSDELISYDSPLVYRFYIEDEDGSYDIERNCHYHITVTPEDDGLSQNGWKADKSGIGPVIPVFELMPGDLVKGHVGDTVRIWCECYPRTAPFDPGYEELNYDKSIGIYDYRVDDDGHGVTLYLKKPGTGIVYMSAGHPINRSGMVLVNVMP